MKRCDLRGPGAHLNAVGPVETDTIAAPMLVLDRVVIYIVNPVGIYVVHVAVVVKVVAVPIAAVIAVTGVSVSVIHSTVVPDVPAPEAAMPSVAAFFIAPVAWRPQRSCVRRLNPRAWNPVVAVGSRIPVARRPDVAVAGAGGLIVFRQRRRSLIRIFHRLIVVVVIVVVAVLIGWVFVGGVLLG